MIPGAKMSWFSGIALAFSLWAGLAAAQDQAPALGRQPVSPLIPGNVPPVLQPVPVKLDDPRVIAQGNDYFAQFNCSGCHAPNGGGGMGPALSNRKFTYGGRSDQIFLTIAQGRPNGMPAWGQMLPDDVIWSLVAYIGSLSAEPQDEWGKTTSPTGFTIEQVPADRQETTAPWAHTERFGYGQSPTKKVDPPPPSHGGP